MNPTLAPFQPDYPRPHPQAGGIVRKGKKPLPGSGTITIREPGDLYSFDLETFIAPGGGTYALGIRGDGFAGVHLVEGDVIYVRQQHHAKAGAFAVVILPGGDVDLTYFDGTGHVMGVVVGMARKTGGAH